MTAQRASSLQSDRRAHVRGLKDRLAKGLISIGGMSVLVAILLIFFYLLYEVLPMFRGASVERVASYSVAEAAGSTAPPLFLAMEEQTEIGMRLDREGQVGFFEVATGSPIAQVPVGLPTGARIASFALDSEQNRLLALGLDTGSVLLVRHRYAVSYPEGQRVLSPELVYPFGEAPLVLAEQGGAVRSVAVRDSDRGLLVVGSVDGRLVARQWTKQKSFLNREVKLKERDLVLPQVDISADRLLLSPDQRMLYVVSRSGAYRVVDIQNRQIVDSGSLLERGQLQEIRFLLGGISLLVADSQGDVAQWQLVRNGGEGPRLTPIRRFDLGDQPVRELTVEHRRKGLAAIDGEGRLRLLHTTASRELLTEPVEGDVVAMAISPRANGLLIEAAAGRLQFWSVDNEHPEVSWSALWGKVWYESYPKPDYVWQSSSASDAFEPKYSLTPLAFGTLKAAFYAMLLGAPLAICGAIFTAYFMAPALRQRVKPLIEMMEALPTVILGFLAGLWLAPFFERHLPGVFSVLLLMPVGILLAAWGWRQLPLGWRRRVPDGWEPVLLVPVVIVVAWGCFALSAPIEYAFFGGNMRGWLTNDLGIDFDQRNALVVGVAMGFAVIPNIFSIAEDAIFSVPKHLSYGSLALGATPWQTLMGVVIPTASPGIFSALMIGMGRAVGETMIVLMATGNTPIMDANIFEGMRTLSANLAVEIGETEVDSTHYRVLFLAAFVLFGFTFIVNTIAELVRQRLRRRYSVI